MRLINRYKAQMYMNEFETFKSSFIISDLDTLTIFLRSLRIIGYSIPCNIESYAKEIFDPDLKYIVLWFILYNNERMIRFCTTNSCRDCPGSYCIAYTMMTKRYIDKDIALGIRKV